MYMGMHTLADIIGGLLAASALLFFLIPLGSNTTTNINTNIDTDTNEIQIQKGYKYKKYHKVFCQPRLPLFLIKSKSKYHKVILN